MIEQVVVKHGKLLYLCEPAPFAWLCGKCRGMLPIEPKIRDRCHECDGMVVEVRQSESASARGKQ